MARASVFLFACLLTVSCANAYPLLWRDQFAPTSCSAHPMKAFGGHGAPVEDLATKFVMRDASGSAVKTVCPGQVYTVAVAFPQARLSLTTSNMGMIKAMTGAGADNSCPNRLIVAQNAVAAVNSFTWEIPCFPSGTTCVLRVTSTAGEFSPFQAAQLSVAVDSTCAAKACGVAAAASAKVAASTDPDGAAGAAVGAATLVLAGIAALVV